MADDATPLSDALERDDGLKPPAFLLRDAKAPAPDALVSQQKLEELLERKIPLEQQIANTCRNNKDIGAIKVGKSKVDVLARSATVEQWSIGQIADVLKALEKRSDKIGANTIAQADRQLRVDITTVKNNLKALAGTVQDEVKLRQEHGVMSPAEWLALRDKVKGKLGIAPVAEIIIRATDLAERTEAALKAARIKKSAPAVAEFKINIGKTYEELGAIDKTLEDTYRALTHVAGGKPAADILISGHILKGPAGVPADLTENVKHALDACIAAQAKEAELFTAAHDLTQRAGRLAWAEGETCKAFVGALEEGRNSASGAYRAGLDAQIVRVGEAAAEQTRALLGKTRIFTNAVQNQHAAQTNVLEAINALPEKGKKATELKANLLQIFEAHADNPKLLHVQLRDALKSGKLLNLEHPGFGSKRSFVNVLNEFRTAVADATTSRNALNGLVEAEQLTALESHAKDSAKLGREALITLHGNLDEAKSVNTIIEHLQEATKGLAKTAEDVAKGGKGGMMKWVVGGAVAVVGALGLNAVLNNKPRTQIGERSLVDAQLQQSAAYRG